MLSGNTLEFLSREITILIDAAKSGRVEQVKLQLNNPLVAAQAHVADPRLPQQRGLAPMRNIALVRAATKGHTEIVKLLLALPAVKANAAVNQNEAFCSAILNGHLDVVKQLLQAPIVVSTLTSAFNEYQEENQRNLRFGKEFASECRVYMRLFNPYALNHLYEKAIRAQDHELITLVSANLPWLPLPTDHLLRAEMENIRLQHRTLVGVILDWAQTRVQEMASRLFDFLVEQDPASNPATIESTEPRVSHPVAESHTLANYNLYLPSKQGTSALSSSGQYSLSREETEQAKKNQP